MHGELIAKRIAGAIGSDGTYEHGLNPRMGSRCRLIRTLPAKSVREPIAGESFPGQRMALDLDSDILVD